MKALLPALARPLLEPHLPDGVEAAWFTSPAEANAMIADADIAWVDMQPTRLTSEAIRHAGPNLKWVSTIYAGLDAFPLDFLRERHVVLTNGAGINAVAVAEYAVLGVLAAAKRFDEVVRIADRREWPMDAPGKLELTDTRALVIGYGTIGRLIGDRLAAFGVEVTGVTRSGREGTLTPDAWRARLGDYDWVILAAPSTDDTRTMIGADELAAMKDGAWLINIARGDMIDQDALVAALHAGTIAGAFLDPTDPEPLPADHPLWSAPNCMVTMHFSGRSQTKMFQRAGALFLKNLAAFLAGKPMANVVDLELGY
ncbi:phosphoglycerate dehydrogenase-like enzyme [Sphingomonas jinjuensis]|uniref:Phosphoglycerate dehydrogenase-like enzyme n=1 Tax=Sphingomonas jinjuensis TaxID=535907 RepID=A0A840FCU3_9SPHN|nr:D-2-hydroxyacid dehydrogenase [Sphingomonas jinjuensis]MBB4154462.1 phosphoglycerate dehydrogenase-like enzyme [Sphingomonas jinjuensis]